MKKYKLLKDLPNYKAGTIFEVGINTITQVIEIYTINNNDYKYLKAHIFNTDWFEEIKEVEYPLNWRAEEGEYYFFIDECGYICKTADYRCKEDNCRWKIGNYYQTEEQAKKALEQREAYMEYIRLIEKLNEEWQIDWKDTEQAKYIIYYSHIHAGFDVVECVCVQKRPNVEHFKSADVFHTLLKQLGEDKIKLALGIE